MPDVIDLHDDSKLRDVIDWRDIINSRDVIDLHDVINLYDVIEHNIRSALRQVNVISYHISIDIPRQPHFIWIKITGFINFTDFINFLDFIDFLLIYLLT